MRTKIAALLAITGCTSHASVVQVAAAPPLPPLPPAEIIEATPADPPEEEGSTVRTFDFDDIDIAGATPTLRQPVRAKPVCASGTVSVGGACLTPVAARPAIASGCTLVLNSIPPSHVLVDGSYVGQTPQSAVNRGAGAHVVMFITDDAKKVMTVSCVAGERKVVAVRVRDP